MSRLTAAKHPFDIKGVGPLSTICEKKLLPIRRRAVSFSMQPDIRACSQIVDGCVLLVESFFHCATPMADLDFHTPTHLIEHKVEGEIVPQRPTDGYVNATRLCNQAGKSFNDYSRLKQTKEFLDELALETGIPVSKLVQTIRGRGDRVEQGTWVHPKVAIHLGIWLSPQFSVMVSEWVYDWMSGNFKDYMPPHIKRYLKNKAKIPPMYFSMLNEIYLGFLAPLEDEGIVPPDSVTPDISTGQMFSRFLKQRGIDPTKFPTYDHEFVDGTRPTVKARLYPIEHLADFRRYFHEEWLPQKAETYIKAKFPKALPYLPAILQLTREK